MRQAIHCSHTQCGHLLGYVAPSSVSLRGGIWVWQIQPGWLFVNGILEQRDFTFRSERGASYALTGRERPPERFGVFREADLPVVVRCPVCHGTNWIQPRPRILAAK